MNIQEHNNEQSMNNETMDPSDAESRGHDLGPCGWDMQIIFVNIHDYAN